MKEFAGKVAVVTGAASGMGRAFAQRFAEEGMRVVVADIETPALDRAVGQLRHGGHEAVGVTADVSQPEAVEHVAEVALESFGAVHLVCNNAGVEGYLDGAVWEATAKDWAWTMGVNFWSVVYGVRTFLALLLDNEDGGHMVNTASMTAVTRGRNMYAISKHAVLALTETVYGDLRARDAKVGISALCPGVIATRLFQGSRNRPAGLQNEQPAPGAAQGEEIRARMNDRLAQGMPPSDVAEMLVRGIRDERLYILTDHDWDNEIRARHSNIMSGENPDPAAERSVRR